MSPGFIRRKPVGVVMEWREQSAVSCDEAYLEAQRWIEAVTKKKFGSDDFRSALENGVLLCDLINKIKPGLIRRVNRLPTPIAGLDNLNVFLKACRKLGLKEAQLFHPGDLQDLSTRVTVKHQETNRRLKNVLITIYWLGRRAQCDRFYDGPYLNFKAFEGLLGTALYKALQESSGQKGGNVRDSGFGDSWCSEREEHFQLREEGREGGGGHRRDDSLDSLDSVGSQPQSISSDNTLKGSSEGCCSDTEADSFFKMADKSSLSYRRSSTLTPKASSQFNQFLPTKDKATAYVPAPLRKKRAERNEDNRRSWANSAYTEDEATLTRQQQTQESIDGSKSTSDIQVDTSILRQSRYEDLQKHREQIKDTEDKWQDDLSKWKNRRRSVNSDIVKKKEEREKIEEITYSSRRSKTLKEMQEERENKGRNSVGSRLGSLSYLDNEDVFDTPVIAPRTRALPARSYTIDTPYYSSESLEPPLKEDEPPAASPATGRAASPPTSRRVDTVDSPAGRDTTTITPSSRSFFHRSQSPAAAAAPLQNPVSERKATVKAEETAAAVPSSRSVQKLPELRRPLSGAQTEARAPSSGSLYKQQPQPSSMEPKPPGVSRVSASLPRSYQRSDSARLTSVVAPRPFGTQSSRLASLNRASTVDDPLKRVNGEAVTSQKSAVPSRYHQFMTSEDETQSQSSSAHSTEDEEDEEEEEEKTPAKSVISAQSVSPVPPQVKTEAPVSPAPAKETSQENYCDMRISLNQKPNSSRDFGFQAAWDSTGARVTSIQSGSPAEMCQLQVGDEVLSVNGHQVAGMSYTNWKSCMEEAVQEGSLIMDIRHHGRNNWDRDQPPMPYKSHKTINLTSTDHPILVGSPDAVSSSLDFTSRASMEKLLPKEAPALPVLDMASNGVNGGLREQSVTMRKKESEPISLKNLKRRSEFFEKGGSESAMPDIPVPSITPSSSHWSWDPEEERKRQEKWQKEQERLLQEKYKRDQEKMQEEWLKAQEEVAKSTDQQELRNLEVSRPSVGPLSPLSPVGQPTSPPWEQQQEEEEEERKRKEEQERQRQAEERRKRDEEERELRRLQEERERKRRQEEEERKRREEEELRWQRRKEEEREEERRWQEAAELQRRERERALVEQQQQQQHQQQQQQWTKSKSSPQLDEEEKPQRKGAFVQPRGMAHWLLEEQARSARDKEAQGQRAASELEMERRNILNAMRYREPERVTGSGAAEKKGQQSASQAELERQQILNEMKKKTPLLMDKSWIRQRSSTTTTDIKESDVPPMRRGESLDNLDTSYNSWRSSWTPRSNSHTQSQARPTSALSGSTSFYGGGSSGAQLRGPGSSTLPSSYSMGSLRAGAGTPSSPWSRQSPSPSPSSPSPATSPEPTSEAGAPEPRSRSVSGRKICTFCDSPLGKGAAMIIESLGLCYHLGCFKCIDCKSELGGSAAGAEVRIRNKQLYCNTCYMRFKAGQPTNM
ncbi:LIM domain only protein 7 isoform X3 [Anoplopoma fimbria]|uniref:LIM domain only protein 7 isoform X3 n=1 Tax=Anoplopoma fimbria TaxID=229290 RepID=UPI0023EB742A|nr:LIM domain only protein 7 isoform X3 [Anoplopoma fimbria]